ncbi:MAG: Glucose-1-phosphate adenylyltransferase [Chlamydiae bacterium]|nr:Glucose-1-phosphate adenylyltransferase [Chlamydiota bacterium]
MTQIRITRRGFLKNTGMGIAGLALASCVPAGPAGAPSEDGAISGTEKVTLNMLNVEGDEITQSVIGVRSVIGKDTAIRHSVLMGNEYYERPPLATGQIAENPGIGRDCLISKAIIDENVSIGDRVQLINREGHREYESSGDQPKIFVRDGIIIVPRGTVIPDNFTF